MFLLGIADIVSALFLIRGEFGWQIQPEIITIFAAYLIIKGVVFIFDVTSLFDILAGAVLLLTISNSIHPIILYSLAVFLGFKGAMTLFAKG